MAANSPHDPPQPDDSHIFRRSIPKPPPKPLVEPTDLLDIQDDEDALGGPAPRPGDSPSVIVRRGYSEGSAVNLGGKPGGESGSSIFAHAESVAPSEPGSGWFDTIPPQPRSAPSPAAGADSGQAHVVENHFGGLPTDSAAVPIGDWKEEQATNSVSESEVLRAFDNLSGRHPAQAPDSSLDFNATQASESNIFSHNTDIGSSQADGPDPSGVDLLNPENDDERNSGPRSSIFGETSSQESSKVEIDEIPLDATDSGNLMFPPATGGSSIFKGSSPFLSVEGADDAASGNIEWATRPPDDEFQPSLLMPHAADEDPFADEVTDFTAPMPPVRKGAPVGTAGAGVVVGPPNRNLRDPDDESSAELPKPKRSGGRGPKPPVDERGSGLVGWLGGGAFGFLAGAGAFAGLYFADVLPGKETPKTTTPLAALPTVKDNSEELAALTRKARTLEEDVQTGQVALQKAEAQLAAARSDSASKLEAKDAALAKAEDAKTALLKQKDAAETQAKAARLAVAQAQDETKSAKLEAEKALSDLQASQADLEKSRTEVKTAQLDTEKAKSETKTAVALAEKRAKDLDAAKKTTEEATKLVAEADAKTIDAQKQLKSAQAGVELLVRELKANKLLDEKLDTAQALAALPETFKKLGAATMTTDAKKATEALLAAKKELEAAQAARKSAEESKAKAEAELKSVQQTADDKLAAAQKKAEVEALKAKTEGETAVTRATAEIQKKLADAEAAKAALVAQHQQELAAMREGYAVQLAEARQGGAVQITPAEVLARDRAARDFQTGVLAYQTGNFAQASTALESAVKIDPADARYWYFLGLTRLELGKKDDAEKAFKTGSDLEARSKPNSTLIAESLERVQGATRQELNRYR